MPFEKKKKYKSSEDYSRKCVYLDMENEFQAEASVLLDMCGHKQSKFIGLLIHDFLSRTGIDISSLSRENFADLISLYEKQILTGYGFLIPVVAPAVTQPMPTAVMPQTILSQKKVNNSSPNKVISDDFISEEDMDDMNDALAAFGVV